MARSFWLGGFVLLVVMQTPLLLALDCNGISQPNYNTCMGILNTSLSDTEKSLLISNLDYSNKFYPDNDFIYQRNTLISTPSPPNGTAIYNGQFIKNAWVSLLVLMPSVIYNGSLYVPNRTTALSSYNYQVSLPSDYSGGGYPSTDQGDCRRTYALTQNSLENKFYVNEEYQGSGKSVSCNVNQDSEINSVLGIDVRVNVDHYSWNKYCCYWYYWGCGRYCYSCDYSYREQKKDNPFLSDSLDVKLYKNNLFADLKTTNAYDSNTRFKLNYSDSVELSFQNSEFSFYKYVYSINYSKPPYNFYTLKAEDYNQAISNNILQDGDSFLLKNANNCSIKVFDWFSTIERPCFLDTANFNLSILTNKFSYLEGEDIEVSIYPPDIAVLLDYNNQTVNATGSFVFKSNVSDNRILASYGDSRADRIIFVTDGSEISLAFKLLICFLLIYLIYKLLQRYWRFL